MTTDDFTEAAFAAAEEQWTRELTPGHRLSGPERMNRRIGFTMGAAWARTRLAAQEPTEPSDAEVEAAARAVRDADDDGCIFCRDDETPCSACTKYARAALSAARAAEYETGAEHDDER